MSLPITPGPVTAPGRLQYLDGNDPDAPPYGDYDDVPTKTPPERTSLFGELRCVQTLGVFYFHMEHSEVNGYTDIDPPLTSPGGGDPVAIEYLYTPVPIKIEFEIYDTDTLDTRTETVDFGASATSQNITISEAEQIIGYTRKVRTFG